MRIDTHQHYWHYQAKEYPWITNDIIQLKKNFLPEDIILNLQKHNINGTIAVQARQSIEENEFLLKLSQDNEYIKGIIGWIDLRSNTVSEYLEIYQNTKIKGFRHQIQDELNPSEFFQDESFNKGVNKVLESGYLYELLFKEKDLKAAINFCKRHDQYPMIIDHLGKPDIKHGDYSSWKNKIRAFSKLPHVYCKLSGLITEATPEWQPEEINPYIEIALEVFTPKRLMYGSDWPVCNLAGEYDDVFNLIDLSILQLSETEKESIWQVVAKQLYRI